MRRLVFPIVLLCALALVSSAVAAPLFVVTGRGWGHSVGMSQWGALGYARQGATYEEIIAHYYRGTTLGTRTGNVGVLLADGRSSLSIGADLRINVSDGTNSAGFSSGMRTVTKTSTGKIAFGGMRFASPATFVASTEPIHLGSARYRGKLVVSVLSGALRAVNRVALESYVKGVVPRESPDSWGSSGGQAALEAQAVAARSYALASGGHCGGGLFCQSVSDQVYGGYDAEVGAPNATAAVEATAGKVAMYDSAIAKTFFHSSSGGRTAASVDVWGGSVPYLRSVSDFDLGVAENPHRRWTLALSASQLGSRLGTRPPADATLARDPSDLAQRLTVSGPGWSAAVEGSETLRGRMQVKSARFWIGVLSAQPGRSTITYGDAVTVSGLARRGGTIGWGSALVERNLGGGWNATGTALPDGAWSRKFRPARTTDYRVKSGNATGYAARVSVATKVRFYAPEAPYRELGGFIAPARGRIAVELERRRRDGNWAAVATTTTAGDGTFTFALTRGGTYRASADAGTGLLTGFTPALTVG